MDALTRIRYLTHHYQDLQGYRLLPFAVFFLVGTQYDYWAGYGYEQWKVDYDNTWLMTFGIGMIALGSIAVIASYLIGRWYEERYGYIAPHPDVPRAFPEQQWLILVSAPFIFGFLAGTHDVLCWVGLWIMYRQVKTSPAFVRHVPLAVLYILLVFTFPGIDSGAITYPEPGINHLVVKNLVAAFVLLVAALWNHHLLETLRAPSAVPSEEEA